MRFLVATHSYLLFVYVNDGLEVEDVQVLDSDYFYGSDRWNNRIIAGKRNQPQSKVSTTSFRIYHAETGAQMLSPYIPGHDIYDLHQATVSGDYLIATSCANNRVMFRNLKNDPGFELNFGPDHDYFHINSIYNDNDLYVVFHNLAREPSDIRRFAWAGTDVETLDVHGCKHYSIHNVIVEDGVVLYNASDDGAVIRTQWKEDDYERADLGRDWHPKGLAATDKFVVTGFSEHAVSTPRRFISESGLAFVDRKDWQVVAMPRIELDGEWVGNINEIRLL